MATLTPAESDAPQETASPVEQPGDTPEATDTPTTPKGHMPLPEEGDNSYSSWKHRITASGKIIDDQKVDWDKCLSKILAKKPMGANEKEIVVPKDFANLELKKAQMGARVPKVLVEGRLPGLDDAARIFEAVINWYLGPNGVNAAVAQDEVLTDAIGPCGIFAIKIGYHATVDGEKQVDTGQKQPDPKWKPSAMQVLGAKTGLMAMPQAPLIPVMDTVPNIIHEKYIFDRISPAKLLLAEDFTGSDYDRAAWVGWSYLLDFNAAVAAGYIDKDFRGFVTSDERLLGLRDQSAIAKTRVKMVLCHEVFYKASVFDASVKHPEKQRQLIIVAGAAKEALHRDSPYQRVEADGSLGGMPGFPIHIGALRVSPDNAFPQSDVAMSKNQVKEVSQGRTMMILQRERSVPMRMGDVSVLGEDGLAKIEKNIYQGIIPVPSMDATSAPIREVALAHAPQENFQYDAIANRDIAEIWALPQTAITEGSKPTGAEIGSTKAAQADRLGKEVSKYTQWFGRACEKLGALIQMFSTNTSYVNIVGQDGTKILQAYNNTHLQGKFAFTILPNSSKPVDAQGEQQSFIQMYNLFANAPSINRQELDTEMVRKFDMDPAKLIKQPQPPPPPPPDVPKIAFSFDEKSLNPLNPAFPIVMEILRKGNVPVTDAAIAQAQDQAAKTGLPVSDAGQPPAPGPGGPGAPPAPGGPGGAAQPVEPISKHAFDRSGALPGPKIG